MRIIFAVGYENRVSILDHPDNTLENNAAIDALYSDIEQGNPLILKSELMPGVYHGEFGINGLSDIHIIERHWDKVA